MANLSLPAARASPSGKFSIVSENCLCCISIEKWCNWRSCSFAMIIPSREGHMRVTVVGVFSVLSRKVKQSRISSGMLPFLSRFPGDYTA